MISQQTRNELMNEPEQKEEPKKDSDLANTLKSVERMLSLSPNEEVLKNLLDVIEANEGITENPDQMEQLNRIKVKIVAKLGGNLSENATAGATSSCSIASIPSVIGEKKNKKAKPIRRKMPGLDVMNFLECMKQDVPCGLKIRNKYFKTTMVNETLVLTVDKCVVPELNKDKLLDMVEEYFYTKEPIEVLESCVSPLDYIIMEKGMSFLLEDNQKFDRSNEKNEIDDPQKDANLKSQIGKQTIATVDKKDANEGIKNSETKKGEDEGIKTNQEMVGVDDSDPQNKKYIIKDPQTGKLSVKKQSEVEIQNEAVKYYKKPLLEANRKPREMKMFHRRGEGEAGPLPSIRHFNSDIHTGDNNEVVFDIFWHDETNRKIEAYKHAMRILKEWLGLKGENLEEALRCLKIERPIGRDKDGNDVVLKGWDVSIKSVEELSVDELIAFHNSLNESDLEETKASRFNQHLDNREQSFATISAERRNDNVHKGFGVKSFSDYKDKQERHQDKNYQKYAAFNNRRTRKLYDLLEKMGLIGYIRSKGGYRELTMTDNDVEEENSVFIPNITLEQAIAIGKIFNQDSIMFKEKGSDEINEYATNKSYADGNNIKIGDKTGTTFICCQGRYNSANDKTYYTKPKQTAYKFSFNSEKKN